MCAIAGLIELLLLLAGLDLTDRGQAVLADQLGERHRAIVADRHAVLQRQVFGLHTHRLGQLLAHALGREIHCRTSRRRTPGPARTGGRGIVRVAQRHRHLLDRQAQDFGSDLCHDGIAARADIGHRGGYRRAAVRVEFDLGSGLLQLVGAAGGGDTHADQPVALATLARCLTLVPAEMLRPFLQRAGQVARRIGDLQLRVLLRIVDLAKRDGVHADRLGQFVHGAFHADHADRLARRAHRSRQRPVQPHHVMIDPPVLTTIEEVGADPDGFEEVLVGQVGGDGLVAQRDDPAACFCPEAHPLFGVGTADGRVEDLLTQHHRLDRAAQLLGGDGSGDALGRDAELRAETAADIARDDPHLGLRHAQRLGQLLRVGSRHLVRAVQRQRAIVPYRDRGMGLHRRRVLAGGGIGDVDLDGGILERLVEVALVVMALDQSIGGGFGLVLVSLIVERGVVERFVIDLQPLGRVAGNLEALGDDDRDDFAEIVDGAHALRRRARLAALLRVADEGIVIGDDVDDARNGLHRIGVDRFDLGMPLGRADQHAVGDILDSVFGRIGGGARHLFRAVDPVERFGNHPLHARVEQAVGMRLIHGQRVRVVLAESEHGISPPASVHGASRPGCGASAGS